MLQRNRKPFFWSGIALGVCIVILFVLWPHRPKITEYDTVDVPHEKFRPGVNCQASAIPGGRSSASDVERCVVEETERHRLQSNDLVQQTRAANAAEAQAVLAYKVAWMVLAGTIGGFLTLCAAVAAAIYARAAADAARDSLSHATKASEDELRPWLQLEIVPDKVRILGDQVSARYKVRLKNLGRLPATGVLTESDIFNSRSESDRIRDFLASEFLPSPARVPRTILPQGEINLLGRVKRPRDEIELTQSGGETRIHTMLAVKVAYEWKDGGKGRTCQSFEMYPQGHRDEEGPHGIPINPDGETHRKYDVQQRKFDNIC